MRRAAPRRFARDRSGATAIEFALLALPFLLAMLAVLEYGYVYVINASMDNALATASRLIPPGQAQTQTQTQNRVTTTTPKTHPQFVTAVCKQMLWIANCAGSLQVSAEVESSWTNQTTTPPTQNGQINPNLPFNMGADRCIVLIHSYYPWQMITPAIWTGAAKLNGNSVLLSSAALIMNEPYSAGSASQPTNAC